MTVGRWNNRLTLTLLGCLVLVFAASTAGATTMADAGPHAGIADTGAIKIGFLLDLSGPFASSGADEKRGWELGLREFGSVVNKRKIQTIYADTQGNPTLALAAARRVIQSGVAMIQGPVAANEASAVAGYVGPLGIPTDDLSLCSAAQLEGYAKYKVGFSSGFNCDQPALVAAQYLYKNGSRKVTTIAMDFAFGWLNVGSFKAAFEKLGGQVEKSIWVPLGGDYATFVSQISKDTDAVFALTAGPASVALINAYDSFGLKGKVPLIGGGTVTDQSVLPTMDRRSATGTLSSSDYCDGINSAENKKFVSKYVKAYGRFPGHNAATAYDKARLLVAALRKTNGQTSNKKAFVAALKSTAFTSIRGPFRLSQVTSSPVQSVHICTVQVVNGQLRNIPIQTFNAVKPWGPLSLGEWRAAFTKNSAGRP